MAPLAAIAKVAFSSSSTSLIKRIPTAIYKSTLPLLHPLNIRLIHLESSSPSNPISHLRHEWMAPSGSEQDGVTGNSNEYDAFKSQVESRVIQRVSSVKTEEPQEDYGLGDEEKSSFEQDGGNGDRNFTEAARPCVLEILNLPDKLDISDLFDIFKPFGTVLSVEVSRNPETGTSRGCGYTKLSSLKEAKAAIASLDGSDIDGREIRVKLNQGNQTTSASLSSYQDITFESPYKAFIGNLAWSMTVDKLRDHFTQFGSILSARLIRDRRLAQKRVYGFVSYEAEDQLKAAVAASGMEFNGRKVVVMESVNVKR